VEIAPAAVYEPRNPRLSSLFALVEDYYEEFERAYDERYHQQYGPWRRVVGEVMRKYLECGDLHRGFARLACGRCRYQTILAYSCKCRLFCPSCQQKRVLLFAEWLDTHILEQVSHAQYVFTIPKLLRPIFKYHRRELGLLCQSAWQALREMFQEVAFDRSALPGVVITVQSYGDLLNFHPHIHAIASRGVWSADGCFEPIPTLDALQLMLLFRQHLLANLLACGRIGQATLDILDRFHHPGFSAYEGQSVVAGDSAARERLASYLVHAPFSLARLHYDRAAGIVSYQARASSRSDLPAPAQQRFSPLDALAALTAHIPEKRFQLVRYCGYYSNKARGQRRKRQQATASVTSVATPLPEPDQDDFRRHRRRAWARLIRKVWRADPLVCPKCSGPLRIISFIENSSAIEKILRHLKLWSPPERPPPPRSSTTLEYDSDFLAWQAAGRLFDGID
jgi:Transposase zinc-binding domain/Putative transposase